MWTVEYRPRYDRSSLRYPSDLTDAEWSLISPLISPLESGSRNLRSMGGQRSEADPCNDMLRATINGTASRTCYPAAQEQSAGRPPRPPAVDAVLYRFRVGMP